MGNSKKKLSKTAIIDFSIELYNGTLYSNKGEENSYNLGAQFCAKPRHIRIFRILFHKKKNRQCIIY